MMLNETYTLANGVEIPKIGLGTWMMEGSVATDAVKTAIELGYRHIDTAQDYFNEKEVGEAIKASGVAREDIFVTTKLSAQYKSYDGAAKAIEESLALLDTGYIDLMIIHSPKPWELFQEEDRHFAGNIEAWRALEDAYKAGKIKAIGVSNFQQEDIQNILDNATVKPAVNQILAHITNTPDELIAFCEAQDILVEAFSPIGHGLLFKNDTITMMADDYNVTVAQLCIRYTLQLGLLPLPKTVTPAHMKNNADVDFIISDADMNTLRSLDKISDYGELSMFPVFQ